MKKLLSILGNIFTVLLLVVSISLTTLVILSVRNEHNIPNLFGYSIMSVQTDSMEGENGFYVGDLIVVRLLDFEEAKQLKVGDVITFERISNNQKYLETHRIVENTYETRFVNEVKDGVLVHGGIPNYVTMGDNTPLIDMASNGEIDYARPNTIVGIWEGTTIPKVGAILDFMRSQMGFMICIVLPVALFFIYQLYVFIATLSAKKKEEALAAVSDKEAELKAKAVAEFLAQQQAQGGTSAPAEQTTPPAPAPVEEKKEEKPAEDPAGISDEDKARIIAEYMAKQAEALHKKDGE